MVTGEVVSVSLCAREGTQQIHQAEIGLAYDRQLHYLTVHPEEYDHWPPQLGDRVEYEPESIRPAKFHTSYRLVVK